MAREIINVHRDIKQLMVDVIREFPGKKLRYDDTTYKAPVYRLVPATANEMIIRQEFVQTVYKLTGCAREIPTSKLREVLEHVQVVL